MGASLLATITFSASAYVIEITYNDPQFFSTSTPEAKRLYELELFDQPVETEAVLSATQSDELAANDRGWLHATWNILKSHIRMPEFNPTFATAIVLAFASIACLFIWTKSKPLPVSANALLVKAEAWDSSPHTNISPGVVRQRVSIATPQGSTTRTIYRDVREFGLRSSRSRLPTSKY